MLLHLAKDAQLQLEAAAEAAAVEVDAASQDELLLRLPLLRSLFYEWLRMHGPAPFILLQAAEDVTFMGETFPPDPSVLFLLHTGHIGQTGSVGPDPGRFIARRWLEPDGSVRPLPPEVMPFGHGVRMCPGKDLPVLESLLTVAKLLQAFSLALAADHQDVGSITAFTQQPDRDMCIACTKRRQA